MKVMISQPMNGKTNEQIIEERKSIVDLLEKEGHQIINTIFEIEAPEDVDTAMYYLAKSIEAMSKADAVVFLPGWESARGCRIEYQAAQSYGKFIKII